MALQVRYLVPNPDLTICPSPGTMYRITNRFYGLMRRVSSDGPAWTSSRGPEKTSIWSEEDDEEMTLPDPEIPLVYSLHYAQQGRQDWEDELPPETMGRMTKQEKGKSNLHAEEDFVQKLESMYLDPRHSQLIQRYQEVFEVLPPPLSYKKLVQMDLKLKPEFEGSVVRWRPYPAPQDKMDEIELQIQECIDAGLGKEYKHGDYPRHCSPCFLVAKPSSTAMRFVVYYGEVNKETQSHSGSIPNTEKTLE